MRMCVSDLSGTHVDSNIIYTFSIQALHQSHSVCCIALQRSVQVCSCLVGPLRSLGPGERVHNETILVFLHHVHLVAVGW